MLNRGHDLNPADRVAVGKRARQVVQRCIGQEPATRLFAKVFHQFGEILVGNRSLDLRVPARVVAECFLESQQFELSYGLPVKELLLVGKQAAANDDAIVLSLGSTHSFPIEEVFGYLSPETVRHILIQAMLDAPMFGIRWRWNASRALAVIRRRADQRVPAHLQRMASEDLVAQRRHCQQAWQQTERSA